MKKQFFFLYIKLHQTKCLYFPFLFSSSVLYSLFSFSTSSLFGTQPQFTHPPAKSSTLPIRKMPVFQGVAPRHTIFISSCVIHIYTAHSFSGLIVLLMFSHYPAWALLGLVLTHITY